MNHWSKYNDTLKDVKLEGDTLIDLQKVRNALNTTCTSTLNANKRLGNYDKFNSIFSASNVLIQHFGQTQKKASNVCLRN